MDESTDRTLCQGYQLGGPRQDLIQKGHQEAWEARMEKKLEEIMRWKEQGEQPKLPKISIALPFSKKIIEEVIPYTFKAPSLKKYDGAGDPQEHITAYQASMMLMGASDATMCKAFFPTLSRLAQRWFMGLAEDSIQSFYDLAVNFVAHFMRGRKAKKHFSYLATIKQRSEETLPEFLNRWRAEVLEVEGMDDKSAVTLFTEALKVGDLYRSFKRKPPTNYAAALAKADRYADTEEAQR